MLILTKAAFVMMVSFILSWIFCYSNFTKEEIGSGIEPFFRGKT